MIYDIETSTTFAALLKINKKHAASTAPASGGADAGYKAMMKNFDKC